MAFKMNGFPMHEGVKHKGDADPVSSEPESKQLQKGGRLGPKHTVSDLKEFDPTLDEILDIRDEAQEKYKKATTTSKETGGHIPSKEYTDSVNTEGHALDKFASDQMKRYREKNKNK